MSDPEPSQLRSLINAARAGDAEARNALFEKCRSYVTLMARMQVDSWMGRKIDASDLVQQTMLEAHKAFPDFRGETEGEWLAWLKQILTHNTTDFVRQYKGTAKRDIGKEQPLEKVVAGEDFRIDPQLPDDSPSQILQQREQELELACAIEQLSEDHREVIILRSLQRLPFSEIAERMGRTGPATQMLWTRAVKELERLMSHPSQERTNEEPDGESR